LLIYYIFLLKYSHFGPRDARELFNLCYAKLHNVIEHIFGVSKHHFKILNIAPEYPFKTQCKLLPVLCALHNFIWIQDPLDDAYDLNYVSYSQLSQNNMDNQRDRLDKNYEEMRKGY